MTTTLDPRTDLARLSLWLAIRRVAARAVPHVAVAAAVLLIGLPTVILPFGPDQAIFATIGKTISDGGYPYLDAWDQKPPGIYLIYAAGIHGPLGIMRNLRVFDLAWAAATVVVLVELGRRWWSLRAGVIAGLVYGAVYVTISGWWQLAQPDSFIGLPLAFALLLYDAARGRRGVLVLAGLVLGFAFQLRFIMALLIPFMPLVELTETRSGRLRLWLHRMVWLGVGFAALQLALALWLASGGALGEYVDATRFATGYTGLGGPWSPPEGPTLGSYLQTLRFSFLYWALARLVLTAPAIIGGFVGVFVLRDRRVGQLVLFLVLAYAGIAAQAKFFWYHFSYMLPFLALLGGWTWDRTYRYLRELRSGRTALAATGLLATALLLSTPEVLDTGLSQWRSYVQYYTRPHEREYFYDLFGPWGAGGGFAYRASRNTAYEIRIRTQPGDSIYVWGYDPLIYLLADRPHASRFIYAFPLMSDWAPDAWTSEFLADMQAHAPVYFVTQRNEGGPWITGHNIDPADYVDWFPALRYWLDNNYDLEMEVEDYQLYRRRW